MFLKRLERRHGRKKHSYWALVESIRTAKGSRHRVVAYLGDLKKRERNGWAHLGRRLDKKSRPHPSLFDPPSDPEPQDDVELVRIKGIRLERARDFGDVWLALGLWRLLGLDTLLSRVMPCGREQAPWPTVAAILTTARLCEPSSELHIEDTWYRRTALPDLLGVAVQQVHTDRLYAGLDQLLPHKRTLEKHLKERLGNLFDLKYDLLLYDITSTYFEGQCLGNPMARRGYSRDSRPDCKQVCIGLVVTTDGLPLGYEVFDGNSGDSTTVETIVTAMEAQYGQAGRVWVMDRGMVSEKNLEFLRGRTAAYIVGTPKSMLKQFEQHLIQKDWHEVQAGVEVKLVPGPDGAETFILARSADRREKERPCINGSWNGWKRISSGWRPRPRADDYATPAWPMSGWVGCESATGAGPALSTFASRPSTRPTARPASASPGPASRAGTSGRNVRKAATCCEPTWPRRTPRGCGSGISN